MITLVKQTAPADVGEAQKTPIARFLLLARKIHAKFTQEEEKERTARHAAEALAERKNAAIIQSVQEVVEFCQILSQTPGLRDAFSSNAKDIAERTLSNRYAYTMEDEPIAVSYEVPIYTVNMKAIDGTVMSGAENAHLSIGFCPVRIGPSPEQPLDVPSMSTHVFFAKKYHIEVDGKITLHKKEADPISDIITELRTQMGHGFFEEVLLPHLEAQLVAVDNRNNS
jgi:hypothetical protein